MSGSPSTVPAARLGTAWTPLTGPAHVIALEVLLDGPLPRSELARRLDLSAASLTRLTKPLLDSGLLVEADSVTRPPGDRRAPSMSTTGPTTSWGSN